MSSIYLRRVRYVVYDIFSHDEVSVKHELTRDPPDSDGNYGSDASTEDGNALAM
jgi:hypothetical protein